jgi:hypothetical protein
MGQDLSRTMDTKLVPDNCQLSGISESASRRDTRTRIARLRTAGSASQDPNQDHVDGSRKRLVLQEHWTCLYVLHLICFGYYSFLPGLPLSSPSFPLSLSFFPSSSFRFPSILLLVFLSQSLCLPVFLFPSVRTTLHSEEAEVGEIMIP